MNIVYVPGNLVVDLNSQTCHVAGGNYPPEIVLPVPGHYVHCDLQLLQKQAQLKKRMKKPMEIILLLKVTQSSPSDQNQEL